MAIILWFFYPPMTRSKIGAVLHLRWREKDGSFFHLDCDLTVPTFPTQDRYDGGRNDAVRYLYREKPVGWREECGKLLDLVGMAGSPHLIDPASWQIKMRLINLSTVFPSQVGTSTDLSSSLPQSLLFLRDDTLRGRKREVYVLAKMAKTFTASRAKSIQLKMAVNSVLANNIDIPSTDLGASLRSVLQYRDIRGQFSSIHPDLLAEGFTRVDVTDEGLCFLRDTAQGECCNQLECD